MLRLERQRKISSNRMRYYLFNRNEWVKHDNWTARALSTNTNAIGCCLEYRSFQTRFDRTLVPILPHEFPASERTMEIRSGTLHLRRLPR
jgi:hypothetical protein